MTASLNKHLHFILGMALREIHTFVAFICIVDIIRTSQQTNQTNKQISNVASCTLHVQVVSNVIWILDRVKMRVIRPDGPLTTILLSESPDNLCLYVGKNIFSFWKKKCFKNILEWIDESVLKWNSYEVRTYVLRSSDYGDRILLRKVGL
jgi:hypothetical protein